VSVLPATAVQLTKTPLAIELVALQALSKPEDRAVATSTRNLLRSLGGVAGVAISTAVHYAATESAMRGNVPAEIVSSVMGGRWREDNAQAAQYDTAILNARMKGFQAVFSMLVPFMALCLVGSFFISDEILKGDEKKEARRSLRINAAVVNPAAGKSENV
jgi:hypothetical protein